MNFFTSEVGASIAWICTVGGFIYGFFQTKGKRKLKVEIDNLQIENKTLNTRVRNLNLKITDFSRNEITQSGEKNVQTNSNTGGMTINM